MRQAGGWGPHDGQTWKTFLKNHSTWACDFLQLYDVWFAAPSALPRVARAVGLCATRPLRALRLQPIFAFFIVDVNTKRLVHVGVTRAPTEEWTAQQLREVTALA
ncbi:MAG TPA: hypothetical protein VKP30_28835 [Polyangiaceae bacterium]|nr:hypothetical protein [Polyangiaceae bacterium]